MPLFPWGPSLNVSVKKLIKHEEKLIEYGNHVAIKEYLNSVFHSKCLENVKELNET